MTANLIPEHAEIVALDIESEAGRIKTNLTNIERCDTRPLLIGHSIATSGRSLLIMGGGAVCFSFGTFWNKGCYTILPAEDDGGNFQGPDKQVTGSSEPWSYLNTVDSESSQPPKISLRPSPLENQKPREPITIARKKISSWTDFATILSSGEPIILEGLDIGSCTDLWTNSYLLDRIGQHRDASHFLSQNSSFLTYAGNRSPSQRGPHGLRIKKLSICNEGLRQLHRIHRQRRKAISTIIGNWQAIRVACRYISRLP
jgi:hypothetical protein